MATAFEDMTNKDLKEACEDFGLEVKSENPKRPTKDEYVAVLNAFKIEQAKINGIDLEEQAALEAEGAAAKKDPTSKRKPQSKVQLMKLDLFRKDRVIVHDQQDNQTKDAMISISWGNRLVGGQTDWIDLSGSPQYIRRGAIQNLKDATCTLQTNKGNGGGVQYETKSRFIVVPVDGLTEPELAELAKKQEARNAKF